MKKNIILLVFLILCLNHRIHYAAIGIVMFGYTVLLQEILKSIPLLTKQIQKLPGPEWIKEKSYYWIASELVDFAGLYVFYIIYQK